MRWATIAEALPTSSSTSSLMSSDDDHAERGRLSLAERASPLNLIPLRVLHKRGIRDGSLRVRPGRIAETKEGLMKLEWGHESRS